MAFSDDFVDKLCCRLKQLGAPKVQQQTCFSFGQWWTIYQYQKISRDVSSSRFVLNWKGVECWSIIGTSQSLSTQPANFSRCYYLQCSFWSGRMFLRWACRTQYHWKWCESLELFLGTTCFLVNQFCGPGEWDKTGLCRDVCWSGRGHTYVSLCKYPSCTFRPGVHEG